MNPAQSCADIKQIISLFEINYSQIYENDM